MISYDYAIVGMGCTGIVIGLHLMTTDKRVLFIEADEHVGGCWKSHFDDEGYFVEHSPKVLSKTGSIHFNKLLRFLKIDPLYKNVYSNRSILKTTKELINYLSITDIVKLIVYCLLYMFAYNDKSITVKDWCISNKLSTEAIKYINIYSIAISNTNDKLTMHSFVEFMFKRYQYILNLQQLSKPNEWISKAYDILKTNKNFTFMTKTKVEKLIVSDKNIAGLITDKKNTVVAKSYILAVPLRSLYKIMLSSNTPNWFTSFNTFEHYVKQSSYTGIGFQMHFDVPITEPNEWCWSCFGSWKVIVLNKSNTMACVSKDKDIRSVLSCVIVDTESKSTFLNKSVLECTSLDEIVQEGIRQIYEQSKLAKYPKKITISNNITNDSVFGWESADSSFSNSMGSIPNKGYIQNLYAVGPYNKKEVVIIETAITNALDFCKNVLKIKPIF